MKTFQTQCPNCFQVFTISESRLAVNDGRGRCPHCKQVFSAKENLVKTPPPLTETQKEALAQLQQQKQHLVSTGVTAPTPPVTPTPVTAVTTAPTIEKATEKANEQVHEQTVTQPETVTLPSQNPTAPSPKPAVTTSVEPSIDFDLTDDFAPSANHSTALTKKQKRAKTGEGLISDDEIPDELANEVLVKKPSASPVNTDIELDILEDFDLQPNVKKVDIDYHQPESNTVSTDKSKIGDESWLEEMLAEEKVKEREKSFLADSRHNPVGAKSDVADLLDDLGVDVVPEVALSQDAYVQKLSERLEQTKSSQQAYEKKSLLVPLLWGFGCLFLLGLLAVQYVVFNVDNLMKNKDHAQTLTSLCQTTHLPCNLSQADLASVDIKTLNVENNAGKTDVLFTLTNKSSQPVLYPNLKISLQKNNSSVATLVLSPAQYLDEKTDQMAPQQIKPIKLRLEVVRNSFDQALIESFY